MRSAGYRTRFEAIEKRLDEVEQGNARLESAALTTARAGDFEARDPPKPRREDRRPGGSQHPHGGDRLSRVDIVFEVAGRRYPLDERPATLMAENLRVKAAHEPGADGAVGARAVADAIELRLIEDTADPIPLGGDGAEAVYYAPNVPNGGSDQLWALYRAVKRLHDERLRQKS